MDSSAEVAEDPIVRIDFITSDLYSIDIWLGHKLGSVVWHRLILIVA